MSTESQAATPGHPDPEVPAARRPRRRSLAKKVFLVSATTLFVILASVGAYLGIGLYRIDHNVHHVEVSAALLSKGQNDLLAIVKGPRNTEEIYVFHATPGRTNVLRIPSRLDIAGPDGRPVAVSSLSIRQPDAIISGLRRLGIPIGRYVGVDLHAVSPTSALGRLATGKTSVTSLIADPTGTTSLIEAVAKHVYLGPDTPTSALMTLMKVPAGKPVSVPTSKDSRGRVILAAAYGNVLRKFL
jgi:hypothetical protein